MGCKVDTLTLSVEQKELAEERIKQAGVEDKVTVHLMDYRNLPREFKKQFDAVVSLEMLEVNPYAHHWRMIQVNLNSGCRSKVHG